jgi:hypothetical protein
LSTTEIQVKFIGHAFSTSQYVWLVYLPKEEEEEGSRERPRERERERNNTRKAYNCHDL